MVDVIVSRQTDHQNVGHFALPQCFCGQRSAGKVEYQCVGKRTLQQGAVIAQTGRLILRRAVHDGQASRAAGPGGLEIAVGGLGGVEAINPCRMCAHVVGAGSKLARAAHVHVGGARPASRQDGTPVLAGDGDHSGTRIGAAQHIAHGLDLQVLRTGAVLRPRALADVSGRAVLGAVHGLARIGVAPLVANDAAAAGAGATEQRGVAGCCHGEGMVVMGVGKPAATLQKARKAVFHKLRAIGIDLALWQAIDDDQNDQFGAFGCWRGGVAGTAGEQHRE